MQTYKFFWDTHKWTGIVLSLVFVMIAVTGFLLLIKKDHAWIQPPTQEGAEGSVEDFLPLDQMFAKVFAEGHPDFQSMDDIDRVDFRPGKRVHKVRSVHNHSEIQVDAVTGAILSVDTRTSDLLEQIHDGSFFGDWAHDWFMPVVPFALLFLVGSGLYLWLAPKIRKARNRRKRPMLSAPAQRGPPPQPTPPGPTKDGPARTT